MSMITNKEVIKAYNTIIRFCDQRDSCTDPKCPLYAECMETNGSVFRPRLNGIPSSWEIKKGE